MPKLRGDLLGVVLGSTGGPVDGRHQTQHDGRGYLKMTIGGERILTHRAVWTALRGPLEPGQIVHHKDGDTSNNALRNLEAMSRREHITLHAKKRRKQNASN